MARHRRPVNVRDDGLPAVLGPLITTSGLELAVLLDVDSGMVLDAWARGGAAARGGDPETLGARLADVLRALLALAGAPPAELPLAGAPPAELSLAGAPPAELSLVVDGRHHLVRCVADPAGGRLALAVVVTGSPRVVRTVRRHLRQLPDAGLTTGPWLLSWAFGPAPKPRPRAELAPTDAGPITAGRSSAAVAGWVSPMVDGPPQAPAFGDPAAAGSRACPTPRAPDRDPAPADGRAVSAPTTGGAGTGLDPRRGPAPPSALPPARSAGGR